MKDTEVTSYDHLTPEEMQVGLHVAKVGLGSVDYVTNTVKLDQLAARMFDLPASTEVTREILHDRIHPEDRGNVERLVTELLDPMDINTFDASHRVIRPSDGSIAWIRVRKKIWFQGEGDEAKPDKAVFAVIDITTEKRAQALSETLIGELRHRGKNVITVISGIARQLSRHSDPEAFPEKLVSRLNALSRNMYTVDAQGRSHSSLQDVFTQQVEPFADHVNRIAFDGPQVNLSQDAAQILAMVAHELLTNAAKYGALSNEKGRVEVTWQLDHQDDGNLHLSWREIDGPTVVAPTREGYGSQVVTGLTRMSLQAEVAMDYAPNGLVAEFTIPLSQITQS